MQQLIKKIPQRYISKREKRKAFYCGVKAKSDGMNKADNPYVDSDVGLAFFWVKGFEA